MKNQNLLCNLKLLDKILIYKFNHLQKVKIQLNKMKKNFNIKLKKKLNQKLKRTFNQILFNKI